MRGARARESSQPPWTLPHPGFSPSLLPLSSPPALRASLDGRPGLVGGRLIAMKEQPCGPDFALFAGHGLKSGTPGTPGRAIAVDGTAHEEDVHRESLIVKPVKAGCSRRGRGYEACGWTVEEATLRVSRADVPGTRCSRVQRVMANERGPTGIACAIRRGRIGRPPPSDVGGWGTAAVRLIVTAARRARTGAASTVLPLPHQTQRPPPSGGFCSLSLF